MLFNHLRDHTTIIIKTTTGIDGVESAKKKALDEMTKVLEGDWTPFDVYVGPFRTFAKKVLGESIEDEKRNKWIEKAGMFVICNNHLYCFKHTNKQKNSNHGSKEAD